MSIASSSYLFISLAATKRTARRTLKSASRSSSYPSILCGESKVPPFDLFPLIKARGGPNAEVLLSPACFPYHNRGMKPHKNAVLVCKMLDSGFAY